MAGRALAPEDLETVPTIELLNELKRRHQLLSRPPARVAVIGPPCAGKRTQAEAFRRAFGLCRISAADLLQPASEATEAPSGSTDERAVSRFTSLLDRAQCRRGFVLEGFPSTVPQAQRVQEALQERGTPLDHAIFLGAPEETLLERCRGRLLHPPSGRLYHDKHKPPIEEGMDDYTSEPLVRPPFDEEQFRRHHQRYQEESGLLFEFFKRAGLAREVSAAGALDEVSSACSEAVKGK